MPHVGRLDKNNRDWPAPLASPMAHASRSKGRDEGDDYIPPVIETQGNFTSEFDVPSRVALPSDGREVTVALSRQTIPVKLRLRTVPRLETSAVITAEAPRPEGVWLPGTMQLLRDASYVGTTRWDPQASDKFMFSFGRDDLVRLTVNRTSEKTGTAGLLSQPERRVGDVYSVTSFHKKPIELLLLEASPVSTSEEVKVKAAFQPQPTIDRWEQRPGIVGWETTIDPKQTLKFNVDYVIGYPRAGTVTGLP